VTPHKILSIDGGTDLAALVRIIRRKKKKIGGKSKTRQRCRVFPSDFGRDVLCALRHFPARWIDEIDHRFFSAVRK